MASLLPANLKARQATHSVEVELTNLYQAGDPSLRVLHNYLSQEYERLKDKLVVTDPSVVAKLQGEASAFKKIMDVLTNARKIGP